ncbi:MAG: PIG-L family deacetylase [Rhodospirillales bacterium]|nr:PIG-L family deacetylase [Rhodospirillales bacterium]
MLRLTPKQASPSSLQVLCLGAHSDDIEIGCGGTVLRLQDEYPELHVHWVVFGAIGDRMQEARSSAEAFLANVKNKTIILKQFRDSFFPYVGEQIKECFEEIKKDVSPDIILTHYRDDLHQDHRLICDFTWNTFRDHLILEYEIPKYDGDMGRPNLFVPLDKPICDRKAALIVESFRSQTGRQWFSEDTFLALMRLRGVEANSPSRFAEAFYCRKILV